MTFTGALANSIRNSTTLSGRASRHEFWCFMLFYMWVWFLMFTLLLCVPELAPVFLLAALSSILPMFAVTVRRLHDIDRSAYWMLLSFVPVVGSYLLSWMLTCPGSPGENSYGPAPGMLQAA